MDVSVYGDEDGFLCDAVPDGLGVAECFSEVSAGDQLITFEVTDLDGNLNRATAYLTVTSSYDVDNDVDGWTENQGDCNDLDRSINPGAEEVYNGVDDNCDSVIDEGTVGYDDDLDGFTELQGDCDDENRFSFPGANEFEDGFDNDCDGQIDEQTDASDDDGDGFSENEGDCNDAVAAISPNALEMCDLIDNNCDGRADEPNAYDCTTYYEDVDEDGYGNTASSECRCAADADYSATNSLDCYDNNDNVYPAQSNYFGVQRGDGSYDYNCDTVETKRYTASYACAWQVVSCSTTAGWQGGVPSCGDDATWVYDCTWSGTGCQIHTNSRTQTCK